MEPGARQRATADSLCVGASSAAQLEVLDGVRAAHRERDDMLDVEGASALDAASLIPLEDRLPNLAGGSARACARRPTRPSADFVVASSRPGRRCALEARLATCRGETLD